MYSDADPDLNADWKYLHMFFNTFGGLHRGLFVTEDERVRDS